MEMTAQAYRKLMGMLADEGSSEMSAEAYVEMVKAKPIASSTAPARTSQALEDFRDWLNTVSPYPVEEEARAIKGRHFAFDFFVPDLRLAFEYDGVKDHGSIRGSERDAMKGNLAQLQGILFIRVNSRSIRSGVAYQIAEEAFQYRGATILGGVIHE